MTTARRNLWWDLKHAVERWEVSHDDTRLSEVLPFPFMLLGNRAAFIEDCTH